VGVLNGAVGDTLERRGNVLALPMVLRHGGQDLAVTTDAIRLAYPEADSRLVVFVHGLGQTDDAWRLHAGRRAPYGARLHDDLGYTPLYVRYNSGRRVSDNGRDLARLLGSVVAAWPSDVREIALIGHSIGGLVACSACQFGAGSDWADKVRHVFTLGTSHAGSPLERVIHAIAGTLGRLPETRPLARAIDVRSAGIKDLRYGSRALERTTAPFLPTAEHYFLSVTSARGGATQLDLLNHPAIYEQIRSRLVASKALPPAR
jgi:pimeloyl-ACP methyl ester carboxylesterase